VTQTLRRSQIQLLAVVFICVAGCSSSDGTVNGTVTLDSQPLKEGIVRFVPVGGKSQTATANIKDGKFTATVPPGEMRVEFSAPKVVGRHKMMDTPDSPMVDDVDELLPARFNTQSDIKITVKRGGQREAFALASK
jgi:hypothetical protein